MNSFTPPPNYCAPTNPGRKRRKPKHTPGMKLRLALGRQKVAARKAAEFADEKFRKIKDAERRASLKQRILPQWIRASIEATIRRRKNAGVRTCRHAK